MKILVTLFLFAAAAFGAAAEPFQMRAVQLDLARQMETVPFVKRYLAFAKDSGFNTVVLYLEGRVRTKHFPYRSEKNTYSVDEMKAIVTEAQRLGIDIVPVVSVLGHCENFFGFPEMDGLSEERASRGRFAWSTRKETFCPSLPEARQFLEDYLADIFEIFPGKNVHVGLDESFNVGFCSLCKPKMAKIGLGSIYMDVINWAHDYLAKKGKRMWMWDDFFEYFPEKVGEIPNDIVMCNWEYSNDVSLNRGAYGHFGTRYRNDWLNLYRSLGMDGVASPWRDVINTERYTYYALDARAWGGLVTQWGMNAVFHGLMLPNIRATACWWKEGPRTRTFDAVRDEVITEMFPKLSAVERQAAKTLLDTARREGPSGRTAAEYLNRMSRREKTDAENLAVAILKDSAYKPGLGAVAADPFSPEALLDDMIAQVECNLIGDFFAEIAPRMIGPRRDPTEIMALKSRVRIRQGDIERILARRLAQGAAWRSGCNPEGLAHYPRALAAAARDFLALPETVAADDEWQLEINFQEPSPSGILTFNVFAEVDGAWVQVLKDGGWVPGEGERSCFERTIPVVTRLKKPPTALKIVRTGYNDAGVAFVAMANRTMRLVPAAILGTTGMVRSPENILKDSTSAAYMGDSDCHAQMLNPSRAELVSTLTVSLKDATRYPAIPLHRIDTQKQ